MGQTVAITADDGFTFSAFLETPPGDIRGGMVVVQEIFGVNVHIREVCARLAAEGYVALAPALFDRLQTGVELGYGEADIAVGRDLARVRTDFDRAVLDTLQTGAYLRGLMPSGRKVGCVGYCWGGVVTAAIAVSDSPAIDAAISYYGTGSVNFANRSTTKPVQLHFGDQDHTIPMTDIETLRQAWPSAEIYVYEAMHGFNCDHRASYNAAAAELARMRGYDFLHRHVG
jgi:carboxymethylenebutenolidase